MGIHKGHGGQLCKMSGGQVDIIHGRIDLAQRLNDLHPIHQRLAGLHQFFVQHTLSCNLAVTGRSRDGQQQQGVGIPSRIVHTQEAHHFPTHHNGGRHEAFNPLRRQNIIGL